MNRKYYASDNQRDIINRSLRNDFSEEERYDRRAREYEPSYSKTLIRHRNQPTLDDIDKVNRYVDLLGHTDEYNDRNELLRPPRPKKRPHTPPPPVISFRSDRTNRSEIVEAFERMYPQPRYKPHNSSVERSEHPASRMRRNSMERSPSPRHDRLHGRKMRRRSSEFDPIECSLSPLELLFNRDNAAHLNRRSPVQRDFDAQKRRERFENERRNTFTNRSTDIDSRSATNREDLVLIIAEGSKSSTFKMNWYAVENALCMVYLDIMRDFPGPPPICRDAGWFLGCAKLIECADERSLRLYELAISRIGEVWPGARLKVVNRNEIIPSNIRLRCVTFVPANPGDKHAILERIQKSNPDLSTSDWYISSVGAPSRLNQERTIMINFNIESLADIDNRRGVIKYGFDTLTLKVNRRDRKLAEHVLRKEYSYLNDLDIRPRAERRSFLEIDTEEAIISNSEDDEGTDYSSE